MVSVLHDIGEFGLIKKIAEWTAGPRGSVIRGIGDDTAVIKYTKNKYLLLTTDMLIEDVHFRLSEATPYLIGRKSLAVNISDIIAMGGVPKYAIVALGISGNRKISFIKGIYSGMRDLADRYGIAIVGGDTNRSGKIVISVSLVGEVEKENLVLRSNAKAGDAIFVTGRLGGSYKSKRHLTFTPRLKEARYLVKNFKISSMIDISDGIASDIARIAEESRVGARLDEKAIPLSKTCGIKNALFDGEDFELLFTASEREAVSISRRWPYSLKLTKIGNITGAKGVTELITKTGKIKRIPESGFRHF